MYPVHLCEHTQSTRNRLQIVTITSFYLKTPSDPFPVRNPKFMYETLRVSSS
jgi:hypothetical protein